MRIPEALRGFAWRPRSAIPLLPSLLQPGTSVVEFGILQGNPQKELLLLMIYMP